MKLRQHRGSLSDAMKTIVEIEPTIEAVVEEINKVKEISFFCFQGKAVTPDMVEVKEYGYDGRIGWDTYIVIIKGYGPFGFTDGPIKAVHNVKNYISISATKEAVRSAKEATRSAMETKHYSGTIHINTGLCSTIKKHLASD